MNYMGILTQYMGNKKRGIYNRFSNRFVDIKSEFESPFALVQETKMNFIKNIFSK